MREIIYSHEFDCAADEIGFERVDVAIETVVTVVEGLDKKTYGFARFESDIVSLSLGYN